MLRLKELYSNASQNKEKLAEENKLLRNLLAQHGIPFPRSGGRDDGASPGATGTSPGNNGATGSYSTFSPGSQSATSSGHGGGLPHVSDQQMRQVAQSPENKNIDFEQAGIDFVLT